MRKILYIILPLAIAGCSLKPDMPEIKTEFSYSYETSQIKDLWWEDFNDKSLNSLVKSSLLHNSDLKLASLNLEKANELLALRNKDYLPNLGFNAAAKKMQGSGETYTKAPQAKANDFSLGAILSYEVDLWGRVKNSANAANSNFKATKYDYEAAKQSIISQVAMTYFQLVALNLQQDILNSTIKTYEETRDYRKRQLDEGAISNLIYWQSIAELENAKVKLSDIQNAIELTDSALSYMSNSDFNFVLQKNNVFSKNLPKEPVVPQGISSDILLKRADVASAYERLKASNFLVGVSKTEYFPSLSLTGALGYQSDELDRIFNHNANLWSFGGSFVGKILDFGRTNTKVKIAQIDQNLSLENYKKSVKNAFYEVRNALNSRKNAKIKQNFTHSLLESQSKIYTLAKNRFDEGYSSHLELLDAQRALLQTQIQTINSDLEVIKSILGIYKAFGGGFKADYLKE